jgi:hypothetical protein
MSKRDPTIAELRALCIELDALTPTRAWARIRAVIGAPRRGYAGRDEARADLREILARWPSLPVAAEAAGLSDAVVRAALNHRAASTYAVERVIAALDGLTPTAAAAPVDRRQGEQLRYWRKAARIEITRLGGPTKTAALTGTTAQRLAATLADGTLTEVRALAESLRETTPAPAAPTPTPIPIRVAIADACTRTWPQDEVTVCVTGRTLYRSPGLPDAEEPTRGAPTRVIVGAREAVYRRGAWSGQRQLCEIARKIIPDEKST